MGEPPNSLRRNSLRGLYDKVTLNADQQAQRHIDVLLLDERYDRVPLPCHVRRDYCTDDSVHKGKWHTVRT